MAKPSNDSTHPAARPSVEAGRRAVRATIRRVDRARAQTVLSQLHAAQNAMYAGGDTEPLRALLTDGIEWHVPGDNAIAGDYRGADQVLDYFARRRALAAGSFRLHPGELLVGDGDRVAMLVDGTATIGGTQRSWSTVGLYRIEGDQVAACWLLPLDPVAFDAVWSHAADRPGT